LIRVTVELISANDGRRETLGVMDICNDGMGNQMRRHYDGFLYKKGKVDPKSLFFAGEDKAHRKGRVEDWPAESYVIWRLVLRMLISMFKDQEKWEWKS